MKVPCHFCQADVDPKAPGTYQLTTGWVKNRTSGGGNAVALPERQGKFACGVCIDRLSSNISPFQGTLI